MHSSLNLLLLLAAASTLSCGSEDSDPPTTPGLPSVGETGGSAGASTGGASTGGGAAPATATGGVTASGGSVAAGGSPAAAGGSPAAAGGSPAAAGGSPEASGGSPPAAGGTPAAVGGSGAVERDPPANGCPEPKLTGWATAGPGTTGGGDAAPTVVSSAGDLKSALSGNDARVVHFSGTISGKFTLSSNKTLRGTSKDATIDGGISVNGNNVIVQNLTVKGKGAGDNGDAVNGSGSNIWFDHLNILDGGDGILDLVNGANHITTSWTKFWYTQSNHNHRFALLFSNDSGPAKCKVDGGRQHHTLHHNWFAELVDQRMPRLYYGTAHIYNNFYNSKGNSYCIGVGTWGKAIVENNYFKDVKHPHRRHNNYPTHIEAKGNVYDNTTGDKHTGANSIGEIDGRFAGEECYTKLPDPGPWEPPYQFDLDKAEAIPELVQRCAGPQ